MNFSVLMSTYHGDVPEELDVALESVVRQTVPPNEIVLVQDGPLPEELEAIVEKYVEKYPGLFNIVAMVNNVGLGLALREGLKHCSNDLVARMDSDDFSRPSRFAKQLDYFREHPEIHLLCSWVGMFHQDPQNILFIRQAPITHDEIQQVAKSRNPIYHGSCMYRRSAVLAAGNYCHFPGMEDYYLWARMLMNGNRIECIPEPLYLVRWEDRLINRRSGFRYAFKHLALQKQFLKSGFISFPLFCRNMLVRFVTAVLPACMLGHVRKKAKL